jgi:hypothetical protein
MYFIVSIVMFWLKKEIFWKLALLSSPGKKYEHEIYSTGPLDCADLSEKLG